MRLNITEPQVAQVGGSVTRKRAKRESANPCTPANCTSPAQGRLQLWDLWASPGTCPFQQRVHIGLLEKGLDFDKCTFSGECQPSQLEGFEACGGLSARSVQLIVDTDGTSIAESTTIIEYLSQKYPSSGSALIPSDPAKAAKARLFSPVFFNSFSTHMVQSLRANTLQQCKAHMAQLCQGMKVLDRFLMTHGGAGQGPYLHGTSYSIAEVSAAPFLVIGVALLRAHRSFDVIQTALSMGLLRFAMWAQAVLSRPSTKQTSLPPHVIACAAVESYRIILADDLK